MRGLRFAGLFSIMGCLFAQYTTEIGVALGPSNSLTDIGGWDKPRRDFIWDLKLNSTRWEIGVFGKKMLWRSDLWGAVKLAWLRIAGADSNSVYPPRYYRNLSFRTDIIELTVKVDWIYFTDYDVGRTGRYLYQLRAYWFLGTGVIYFIPRGKYNGKWYNLRLLRTEGQEKPYSPFLPFISFGPGVSFTMHKKYRFAWEFAWRIPFPFFRNADYLDDIHDRYPDPEKLPNDLARKLSNRTYERPRGTSPLGDVEYEQYGPGSPRGNPKDNDNWLSTYFSFSYVLRTRQAFYQKKYSWVVKKKKVHRIKVRYKF